MYMYMHAHTHSCTHTHTCTHAHIHVHVHPTGNPPEQDWRVDEVIHPAEWSEWSEFSSCEGDCELAGRENQTRTCTNPPPSTNPEAEASVLRCEGTDFRDRLCEPSQCQSEMGHAVCVLVNIWEYLCD